MKNLTPFLKDHHDSLINANNNFSQKKLLLEA